MPPVVSGPVLCTTYPLSVSELTTISRKFLVSILSILCFSSSGFAQEDGTPAFEGFSYEKKPPFVPDASQAEQYREWKSSVLQSGPAEVKLDCAPEQQAPVLSEAEVCEIQLALDRTLSNILKLTVDYDALLVRVENMQAALLQRDQNEGSVAGGGDEEQNRLLEAMDLQSKQLIDRDLKIARLEERLVVAQGRFDSENLARLKTEKLIRNQEEQRKSMQLDLDRKDEKILALEKQIEDADQGAQQLLGDLAALQQQGPAAAPAAVAAEPSVQPRAESKPDPVPAGGTDSEYALAEEWVLEGLRFEHGSADIDSASLGELKELLLLLQDQPQLSVQINGYTDSVGSSRSNLKLSQKRADSVATYLVRKGIESYRVSARGYGERRPLGVIETEDGRLRNRRVGVLFLL